MDPITLIVAALVAGAAAGGQDVASSAVKDAYAGLKALLVNRFRRQPAETAAKQEGVLADHEQDPETYEKPLAKAVRESHADEDEEILAAAKALLAQADPQRSATGYYDLSHAQGVQVNGTGNKQKNVFHNN